MQRLAVQAEEEGAGSEAPGLGRVEEEGWD